MTPAYFITLGSEKNTLSIAGVIPQVLFLIEYWTKLDIKNREAKELCYFLIHFIKIKFEFELNSPIYHLNINKTENFCKNLILSFKGCFNFESLNIEGLG